MVVTYKKRGKSWHSPLEAQTRRTQRQWVRCRGWPRSLLVKLSIISVASAFCTLSPNFLSVKSKEELSYCKGQVIAAVLLNMFIKPCNSKSYKEGIQFYQ